MTVTAIETRPTAVTLFEDRAEVRRVATVRLDAASARVVLRGLSVLVDERSLEARASGGALRVASARVVWRFDAEPHLGAPRIAELRREELEQEARVAALVLARDRAERASFHADRLVTRFAERLAGAPERLHDRETRDAHERALDAALDEVEKAAALAHVAARTHERERALLAQTRARADAGAELEPSLRAEVEVELVGEAGASGEIELRYRLPCALWRPEHLARLVTKGSPTSASGAASSAKLALTTAATAWQGTGEAWSSVDLVCSTARPAQAASAPLLVDDVVSARRKTDDEKSRTVVEAREQTIAVGRAEGATTVVDEMPGVDDGGEPRRYAAKGKATLPSTGKPMRFPLEERELEGRVDLVAYAELAPVAHLRFRGALVGGGPLLAGPLRVARGGSLVGRARVGFVGEGDMLEIGCGTDDAVRIRRVVTDERKTAGLGSQKLTRRVQLFVSNLSGDPKRLTLIERVPVSEIGAVEVDVIDSPTWSRRAGAERAERAERAEKDGLYELEVDLAPGAHETRTLTWELRAGAKVQLPF